MDETNKNSKDKQSAALGAELGFLEVIKHCVGVAGVNEANLAASGLQGEQFIKLIDILKDNAYENLTLLKDGRVVGTGKLLYTTALYVDLNTNGFESRYCFEKPQQALEAIEKLNEGKEPVGYVARRGI